MKVIHIDAERLPEAWQEAVLQCWETGVPFQTEYDKEGDPQSKDVLAVIHVHSPMAEPRIHKAFPGGLNDLEKYRCEVLFGAHDHWINPKEGKWQYTYHARLFQYDLPLPLPGKRFYNQIDNVIAKLEEAPHTRRAQAVTWKAWEDQQIGDPACLQRLWFRVENGCLNMTCHIRSNDAYKAGFMNMWAFTEIQAHVASEIGVPVGEYVHIADSFHIYGSYFDEFEGFLSLVEKRKDSQADDIDSLFFSTQYAAEFMIDGVNELLAEKDMPKNRQEILNKRLDVLEAIKAGRVPSEFV